MWNDGDIARIKKNWAGEGKILGVLGRAVFVKQWWIPVLDPDEEDPTFHKEAGLEKL